MMFTIISKTLLYALLLLGVFPDTRCRAFSAKTTTPLETKIKMEETVRRYFLGVHEKDPIKIRSCFGESATRREVCTTNQDITTAADELTERCMEFVQAHPDCRIDFHYGPECGRDSDWVVAHWYELGTWSGESCGVPAPNPPVPMAVEGQTRFRVDPETLKIVEFVVTRTFTDWELEVIASKLTSLKQFAGDEF